MMMTVKKMTAKIATGLALISEALGLFLDALKGFFVDDDLIFH